MARPELDGHVLEACRRGDPEGLRVFFGAYQHRVYSLALYFIGDPSAAQDLTQEVFLKLFSGIREFRGEAGLETWIYRIVANTCIDDQRKRKRFVGLEAAGANRLTDLRPQEERHFRQEVASAVGAAVGRLKPELRLPILLRYVEGLSYQEIAEALDCPTGTVAARLHRGHQILAKKLARLRGLIS